MALAVNDRVKETTAVVGTGTATLLGAALGFQSFAVIGNGNTTYYCISDQGGANWEVGIGTYTASGTTLARTTVLASSNAGGLVVFTAGVKDVFVTYPSEKGVWYDASGNVLFTGTTTATNLAYTGTLTGSTGILNIGSGQVYKDASGNVGIGVIPNTNFAFGAKLQLGPYQGIGATGFVNNLSYYSVGGVPNWRYPLGNATSTSLTGGLGCGGGYYLQFYAAAACSGVVDSVATGVFTPYAVDSSAQHIWKNLTTELMRIASSGNVGIGTSSPSKKLEVAGDILGTTVSASNGFVLNNKNVSASYTFPAGYNAVSVGAVTINSGVVVTVPSTQRWVVL